MNVQLIAVLVATYLAALSLTCCVGTTCIAQQFEALDEQCLDGVATLSGNDSEARDSFCNGPCAKSLAQAYFNCDFTHVANVIQQGCIKDENERFCQDFLRDNNAFDNVTNACARDRACVGACGGAILDFGCCVSLHNTIPLIFSSCNSSYFIQCDLPFLLDPPSTPNTPSPPTDEPAFTDQPPFTFEPPSVHPLLSCLADKYTTDQALTVCLSSMGVQDPMDTSLNNLDPDILASVCDSSCSQTLAQAYFDCESRFGSFYQLIPETGLGNLSIGTLIQSGCAKNNLNPSQVCLELLSDTSYGEQVEQVTAVDGPCVESLASGDCSDACRAAVNSLGCCIRIVTLFDDIPEARILDYCNVQPCAVPFELDGSSKAGTIHRATAVLITISAILSAIMVNVMN